MGQTSGGGEHPWQGDQMQKNAKINVGIGFVTGRKTFPLVLKTDVLNWKESGLLDNGRISVNVLVAYDLNYQGTKISDYTGVPPVLADLVDSLEFIGSAAAGREIDVLIRQGVINASEARMVFNEGYAGKRNIVLYTAIRRNMDYLVFLDDDEYPMAVTNTSRTAIWQGQDVLSTHLRNITQADITCGHHCGYISPIPYVAYSDILTEAEFRTFIEALSNDIVNWGTLKAAMESGGVTYADAKILASDDASEVPEVGRIKPIPGANLCLNLTEPRRTLPFYNPPGARGEDTFLSTCLSERRVLRVPCYTFHDGFSAYTPLLEGVLPIRLKRITADSEEIVTRFYKACIGWIRYKPLLLYITRPDHYEEEIALIRGQLNETLPKVCAVFRNPDFVNILAELNEYVDNVEQHYHEFLETQRIWARIMEHSARHQ